MISIHKIFELTSLVKEFAMTFKKWGMRRPRVTCDTFKNEQIGKCEQVYVVETFLDPTL